MLKLIPHELPGMDDSRRYLTVCLDERVIGYVQMTQIDLNMKKGCFSVEIADEADRGNGYGTEAIRLLKKYAAEVLGLSLLATIVGCDDAIACHILEKQDFICFANQNGCRYYVAGGLC